MQIMVLVFIAIIVLILFVIDFVANTWLPFKYERKHIIMEIGRTKGYEQQYWKKELKKLYLSFFPVIGRFADKFIK